MVAKYSFGVSHMRIAGAAIIFVGFLFCIGTVRIPFGLALIFIGTLLAVFGGRHKDDTTDDLDLELIIVPARTQRDTPPPDAAPKARDSINEVFADGVNFLSRLADRWANLSVKAVKLILSSFNKIQLFRSAVHGAVHKEPRIDRTKSRRGALVPVPAVDTAHRLKSTSVSRVTTDRKRDDFDRMEWEALLKYDQELAQVAAKLSGLGDKWVDELARSYLTRNDKAYLPNIITQIIADARKERGVA